MKPSLLLLCCCFALPLSSCVGPEVAAGVPVKESSGMTYTHEILGNGRHLLTVSDTRFGFGTRANSIQAMNVYAHRWCARRFANGYKLKSIDGDTGTSTVNPSRSFIITEER